MFDLHSSLGNLAKHRPVFHSEADFQHALAWQIREDNVELGAKVRPEYPLEGIGAIDLWVHIGTEIYGIELKYKKKAFKCVVGAEEFSLATDGAYPLNRYAGIYDWVRAEAACGRGARSGYSVFLTNADDYWKQAVGGSEPFSMHEGRVIAPGAVLDWDRDLEKYRSRAPNPLLIGAGGTLRWTNYSHPSGSEHPFRYLLCSYP